MDRPALSGYSTRDVAALLGLSIEQVRSFVRDGFLSPGQGTRGEYRFSFQDLILLRTAKGLLAAQVPHRRIRLALRKLNQQLPGRPLSGVRISARGSQVVVRDGGEVWDPESGQALFDFEVAELAREAASFARREREETRRFPESAEPAEPAERRDPVTADEWYEQGCDLESTAPEEAMAAYRRALQINPDLPDAHLNLGRMLHERAEVGGAEMHYRLALGARPSDSTAAYNLGVALQDQERLEEAAHAYQMALTGDGANADAHFNLSVVYEKLGDRQAAFKHLKTYKTLAGKAP